MATPEFTLRTGRYDAIDSKQFAGSLNGKVAIVTGSGRGIGAEIAFALAQAGASVVVTGRSEAEVDETEAAISAWIETFETDNECIGIVGDVCSEEDMDMLVEVTEEELGPVDILICNAGTNTFMPFHMTDPDGWWRQMEVNVKGPTELTRRVLPSMRTRNAGTIIYTSSRAAKADLPWAAAYSCAKTAITRFAGVLQKEMDILQTKDHGSNGISVFSMHPGEVKTKLHESAFPEKTRVEAPYVIEHMDKMAKSHPDFKSELAAWTCVYLAAGKGKALEGRLVDCTRDIDEVKAHVMAAEKPKITNACGP
ncbi:hypothetical protein BJ166DRAFT_352223 [Pestalotiopsis sp. NC0098]|nr:hypothetical protein BJ166DRAFT_352223 [Pestalotiopsis sp. NC0098]